MLADAMNRRSCIVLVAAALGFSCRFDAEGLGVSESLLPDGALADSALGDAGLDSVVPDDTSIDDTFVADTFVVDTFVADTSVVDTPEVGPPFCDATDTTLVACYRFEGNAKDQSAFKNDLSASGVSYVAGVSGKALSLSPTAKVTAPDTASWAVTTAMTIELWVRPRSLPATGRMGLVDDDGRFGFFVYPPGVVRAMSPAALDTPLPLVVGAWTHVAFTYDGAKMTLYVNGAAVATQAIVGTFGAPSGNGIAVGMNSPSGDVLDGELDSLRVFRIARSAKQICEAAGTC